MTEPMCTNQECNECTSTIAACRRWAREDCMAGRMLKQQIVTVRDFARIVGETEENIRQCIKDGKFMPHAIMVTLEGRTRLFLDAALRQWREQHPGADTQTLEVSPLQVETELAELRERVADLEHDRDYWHGQAIQEKAKADTHFAINQNLCERMQDRIIRLATRLTEVALERDAALAKLAIPPATLSTATTAREVAFKFCSQISQCGICNESCEHSVGGWDREPVGCWLYNLLASCQQESDDARAAVAAMGTERTSDHG